MIFHRSFLSSTFEVGLGLFVVLSVLEFLFPGLATNLVPMPFLAVIVIALGLLTAFRTQHPLPSKTTAAHALPTAAVSVLTLLLVWLTLAPFGTLAGLAAVAAAALGLATHIILTTKTD